MFKARDANVWQCEFPVGFPVDVSALNSIIINIFHDAVAFIESRCVVKAKHVCWSVNSFDSILRWKNCNRAEALMQFFPRKIERINRPTRHVFLHKPVFTSIRISVPLISNNLLDDVKSIQL